MSSNKGIITLDVGGTSMKACLVCEEARILANTIEVFDSMSQASSSVILNHFRSIVLGQLRKATVIGVDVSGIGLAFPGPFDYENGICLIRGLGKYESIFGVNMRDVLANVSGIPRENIAFMNDADAFALGECNFGKGQKFKRAIYLTLGTGIGSTFIDNRAIVNDTAPFGGRMYLVPFRNGHTEDYVSRNGILRIAREIGAGQVNDDVADLAQRAVSGDKIANQVFQQFGEMLGEALSSVCDVFKPNGIVVGGQIAKSAELFIPSLREKMSADIAVTKNSLQSTWLGIYLKFAEHTGLRIHGGTLHETPPKL